MNHIHPACGSAITRARAAALSDSPMQISPLAPAADNARYSFLSEGADPDTVREDLAEAMALLVEWPALDAAIAAATARFDSDPEGALAEQQRLGKRKLELQGRLGQMARKRAASAALKQ